jgi:hypothetical protein
VAFRKHHRNWNGLLAFMRAGKDAKRSQYNTMARGRAVYPIFSHQMVRLAQKLLPFSKT